MTQAGMAHRERQIATRMAHRIMALRSSTHQRHHQAWRQTGARLALYHHGAHGEGSGGQQRWHGRYIISISIAVSSRRSARDRLVPVMRGQSMWRAR